MSRVSRYSLLLIALLFGAGCAGATGTSGGSSRSDGPAQGERPSRTLVIGTRYEPASLASKPLRESGSSVDATIRLFNAELDMEDGRNQTRPYLAEAVPEANTDSWRVFPDGRMETRYTLRPNLKWHDGTPLSAEDFVFAYRVFANPLFATASAPPMTQMENVVALDDRTVVFHWKLLYPDAAGMARSYQPLPRHVLEQAYERLDADAFISQPYWTVDYVGLGPYRLSNWVQGSMVEAVAFDGHVLGRPKIERVIVRYFSDENIAFTNLLAGEVTLATGRALRYEHGDGMKREWASSKKGVVLLAPDTSRFVAVQFRPDLLGDRSLSDVRVRKALMSSIDRQALNDGLFEGGMDMSHLYVNRFTRYDRLKDIDRALVEAERTWTPYPYDPRRSEQLMTEAGFPKGRDGVFTNPSGERANVDIASHTSPQYEKELAILVDTWERSGFDMVPNILSAAALRDGQLRASFPGLYVASSSRLDSFTTANISTAANRWTGNNRGAWSNPEYDRLYNAFNSTLDTEERIRQLSGMMKLLSDELPGWILYFNPSVTAHYSTLKGPDNASPSTDTWNIHEWELS